MAKRKTKLSPKQIAEIGLRAIQAHEEEARQIGKEAGAMIDHEEAGKVAQWRERYAVAAVTASDVRRFENDNEIVGSNTLMGPGIVDTLENCACVTAFLWHYQGLEQPSEIESRAQSGLSLITQMLMDALTRQLDALAPEVAHG